MTVAQQPSLFEQRDLGPAPEAEVARDLAKKALPVAPVIIGLAAIGWGLDGALSAAYALTLVVANFLLAAALISWAARISFALVAGTALLGYLVRLGMIFLAVFVVQDASWVERVPLGLTLVITHLGLLFWEVRFVSASLAFPGLAPSKESATR